FGTSAGLVKEMVSGSTLIKKNDGLPADWVVSIAYTPMDNLLWIGTPFGVAMFEGTKWQTFFTDNGLPDNYISSIITTQKEVLIGTHGGLVVVDLKEFTTKNSFLCKNYTTANGLNSNIITSLCKDDTGVWVGTENGLTYVLGSFSSSDPPKFENYTTANGLPNNYITCIEIDSSSNVYVGTKSGLAHFDGTSWGVYTKENGLAGNMVTALTNVNNQIFVGTNFGLTRITLVSK
ncbi:MAG: two-component regulator propeller domain-containing protein, partial [Planctomycetota bacterium]